MLKWQSMETAEDYQRSGLPILALCYHHADVYEVDNKLTIYAAHCEVNEGNHVDDGPHVLQWGGEWQKDQDGLVLHIPCWWFRFGSNFQEVAYPTLWCPVPHSLMVPTHRVTHHFFGTMYH